MKKTSYNSVPKTLSEKSWQEFSKYLSRYQFALDDPSKSPRKTEIAHAILNKGKPGSCTFYRPEGCKVVLKPLHEWAFKRAITENAKLYYVSYGQTALLYFDIDLHNSWQTEEHGKEAMRLIDKLFRQVFGTDAIFWIKSKRGFNGYLKVNRQGMPPKTANAIFTRLQHALQLFLAYRNNLADFEIKGDFGFMENGEYQWGKYGKLPIHSPDWNFPKLQEFTEKPTVMLARLKLLCDLLEKQIPQDVLDRHNLHKKSLGDAPITKKGYFLVSKAMREALEAKYGEWWGCQFADQCGDSEHRWLGLKYYREGQLPITEKEWRQSQKPAPQVEVKKEPDPVPSVKPVRLVRPASIHPVNLDFSDLIDEPDSFKRQKEALFRYARYLKRVPTLEEALSLFQNNHLFSGSWAENESKRQGRVQSILTFITQTFDASKCANGSVNVGNYDEWAKMKFPDGFTGGRKRYLNEDGKVVRGCRGVRVSPQFIGVFMAIAEFALLIDKNKDDTFPHKRADDLWNALYFKSLITVKFCARKWAVCRDELERHEIIAVPDRSYGPGRAMKWAVGRFFPFLGLWKGEKPASLCIPLQFEKQWVIKPFFQFLSETEPSFPVSLRLEKRETDHTHNTLLYKQPGKLAGNHEKGMPRPPPEEMCGP